MCHIVQCGSRLRKPRAYGISPERSRASRFSSAVLAAEATTLPVRRSKTLSLRRPVFFVMVRIGQSTALMFFVMRWPDISESDRKEDSIFLVIPEGVRIHRVAGYFVQYCQEGPTAPRDLEHDIFLPCLTRVLCNIRTPACDVLCILLEALRSRNSGDSSENCTRATWSNHLS